MTARKPSWLAKKNKMVPEVPVTPVITASSRGRTPGSRRLRVAAATARATASSATVVAATGHRPLPEPARLSPMKSNAKQAPADQARGHPDGRPSPDWSGYLGWPR